MKVLSFFIALLLLQACNGQQNASQGKAQEYHLLSGKNNENLPVATQDTLLNNIQQKITKASYTAFAQGNTQSLDQLEAQLEALNTPNSALKNYWIAYINYYKTIVAMQTKNEELGKKSNEKGIALLEEISPKNSDDYALLILLKGLSFPFVSGFKAPFISKEISNLTQKALKANEQNLRVYYAQGSNDFYTPKQYGGGKKAEAALLKAIELPEQNVGNSHLPTWGKEEAYDLLIRFYLREGQKDKAKTYFEKLKELYPNSYAVYAHQQNF